VDADPDTVLDAAADLRGRGWGDWRREEPVGPLWERVADSDAETGPALVVNAHGTDRGTTADALLLASAPFEVLEGANAMGRVVDASEVVVYASETDEQAVETVREAVEAYPDPAAPMSVVTGPPVYRAAEPTMALEAIEGADRLEARLRRPDALPALGGGRASDGRPALVHTARTLGQLATSLRQNGDHTRLVTVAGDVDAPATVELAGDEPLSAAVDAVEPAGEVDAACVGGRFGGLTDSLDVVADPDALADADLGTDGRVELLAADRCVLEFVGRRAQFAADANCGRCVPCREGATQLADLLRGVYDGDYDPAGIEELTRVMDGTSACDFGVDAARPARTAVARFDDILAAHAEGRCPAGSCFEDGNVAGDSTTAAAATDGGTPEVPR
jgi:NADH-quinone oxidoreductase subunit F